MMHRTMTIEELLHIVALGGAAAQAAAGVLEAGRRPIDLFGMIVIALVSALGGGTLRDVMLDRTVFWIADQSYLITAIIAALITFLAARRFKLPSRLSIVPDAIGMALFTVAGTQAALALGAPWLVASMMGVVTAVFGGIVRDVLAHQPSILLRRELNITAALVSAALFVGLKALSVPTWPAVAVAVVAGFGVRAGALKWGWSLPAFPTAASRY